MQLQTGCSPRNLSASIAADHAQEQRRARHSQLAGSIAAEQAQRCTFRPNVAGELATIEALLTQDDSWLSD
jgi:hypothetical protein